MNKSLGVIIVDLNQEDGRGESKKDSKNLFAVIINYTISFDFNPLLNLISGQSNARAAAYGPAPWSLALNLLDHVLHQNAKRNALLVKKSIFPLNSAKEGTRLGRGIIAYNGIHVALKVAFGGFQQNRIMRPLVVNVDATCVCFWESGPLVQLCYTFLGYRDTTKFSQMFIAAAKNKNDTEWEKSEMGRQLLKLKNLKVFAYHLRDPKNPKLKDRIFSIKRFLRVPPQAYTFEVKAGGDIPAGKYSTVSYFKAKYPQKSLSFATLPAVELSNGAVNAIETLGVVENQKYIHKLDGQQTTAMLNLAAQLPKRRQEAIMKGVQALDWPNDPWLKAFNLRATHSKMIKVPARLLNCPDLEWQAGKKIPMEKTKQGRWMIPGFKFVKTNVDSKLGITSWGIFVVKGIRGPAVSIDETKMFAQTFRQTYTSHGGSFNCGNPHLYLNTIQNLGDKMEEFVEQTTKAFKGIKPQIVFFILVDKSPDVYNVIKKSMDCRFGIASQCVQAMHVKKNQGQYHSNVCLKVNAKLGGSTTFARSRTSLVKEGGFYDPKERVMVLGVDVTHGAPGSDQNSIACLVMSKDPTLTTYTAMVEVNGLRQDIIHREQMDSLFGEQLKGWMRMNGGKLPKRILYFRDGVSREMTQKVLNDEISQIKKTIISQAGNGGDSMRAASSVTFTVIIATKRHHTRVFPEVGDRNCNALPGTLVEVGATNAVDVDWYLVSHVALKGTARPMRYHVVLDENNYKMEALQQFIHEACFQYVRSTTSVSQFPAIYYAHLASRRGVIHEAKPVSAQSGGKKQIDANRLAGMSDRDAVLQYKQERAELRAQFHEQLYMDPVAGQLADHMWYI
jgi:eukaryotic translation initiation factor 2C